MREIFPGIFAVKDDGNRERAPGVNAIADGAQTLMQIFGGSHGAHAAVNESDEIRKHVIAKKSHDFFSISQHAQRRIHAAGIFWNPAAVAAKSAAERASENAFVCAEPLEALFGGEIERLIGNRTFRRPQSGRRAAKKFFVIVARAAQLFGGVIRISKRGN